MRLRKLNSVHIDVTRISYIGPIDSHIKYGVQVNIATYFFLIVVDGYPIEIKDIDKKKLEKIQTKLIDEINVVDSHLPG